MLSRDSLDSLEPGSFFGLPLEVSAVDDSDEVDDVEDADDDDRADDVGCVVETVVDVWL